MKKLNTKVESLALKIVSLDAAIAMTRQVRSDKKIVFMSGVFDLFHFGHFLALNEASHFGDFFIVQIDGNTLVKLRKGQDRPILDQEARAKIISSLQFVDLVYISNIPSNDNNTLGSIAPDTYIRAIIPNQTKEIRYEREEMILRISPNTKVKWLPQTPEISTTKILPVLKR